MPQEPQLKMLRFQLNPHFLFNTLDAGPDDSMPLSREIDAQRLYLDIETTRFADRLEVRDSGAGADSAPATAGSGVGLANIRARLEALYGEGASMEAGPQDDGGFATILHLPFQTAADRDKQSREKEADARTSVP
jgi:LytS/YehU family sensor histidine kinase